ncbi:sugar phosphate isomerase/epimerase [Dysgonomonas sp. Marseille-P4677]|uniref:sugar phosphate isomerase/epimerase family protein n=1 Tax=Dysgonomonas sp. Marseille-P4677 TaxID=2364790 RepID=UPI0019143B76|nr:sugar phosphate isomerase/epimerase [Dysgonomonas sp. Marseille-P4677]MBK5719902.1 sugar phosphate isomerase/epimerase [Dysgonomonas sp. Marseille-P4677]
MKKKIQLLLLFMCAHTLFLAGTLCAKEPDKIGGDDGELFKVAIAGYTFVNFNLDETLKMMQEVDVHYLCIKDFHLPLNSTDEQIAAFHAKLKAHNVTGYAVGPIYMKTNEEVDRAFEYAKRVGVKLIVGVPNHEVLPYVDQKVKEYDFKYAIHLHGPDIKLYPNATDIYENVKNLDPRIGMCLDIGHDARDGQDPIADLKKYKDRVFDIHMKNTTAATKEGKTGEIGRGIIDIPAFVKMLRKVKYSGACSLEYERNMKAPLAGIAESIGYFRGVIDATK